MSKKNRAAKPAEFEQPAAVVEVDPVTAQAHAAMATLDEKEKQYNAEVETLSSALHAAKTKLRQLHTLRKQLNAVLGITEPEAEPVAATE